MSRAPKTKEDESPTTTLLSSPEQHVFSLPVRQLLLGLLLVGLTAIAYAPALRGGFIWDDDSHLTENPCIVGPLGLKDVWTTRAARICPLVQTTFWVEYAVWGLNPLPYHIVNVLVHGVCAVVLWRVLRSLRIRGAWLGATLWALHPVQVETVAWITELKNTQSCLFFLLAIFFFAKSEAPQKPTAAGETYWPYALSLLCGVLAMASKSSTVVLPVVLGLCSLVDQSPVAMADPNKTGSVFFHVSRGRYPVILDATSGRGQPGRICADLGRAHRRRRQSGLVLSG